MPKKLKLFICSGDHYTGHHLARFLVSQHQQRFERITVGATDESRVEDLKRQGIHVVIYNLDDRRELEKHLKGHDLVFLLPPHRTEKKEAGMNLLDACKHAGIRCVLLWSVMEAEKCKGVCKEFAELEKRFKESGIEHRCNMRVGMYMQTFLAYSRHVQKNGELPLPIGEEGKFAPISMRDVSRFAACMLSGKKHHDVGGGRHPANDEWYEAHEDPAGPYAFPEEYRGKTYCLTGPRSVNGQELVQLASKAIGAKLRFKPVDRKESQRMLMEEGMYEEKEVELLLDMFDLVKRGELDNVTDDIEKVTGKKPMDAEEFFRDHARDFKPER